MIRATHRAPARHVSGPHALDYVATIVRHHRIQSSPEFRVASTFVAEELTRAGLTVETRRYPADGQTLTWTSLVPQAWRLRSAELRLVAPEAEIRTRASTLDRQLAVVQRSVATPPDGVTGDLVALDGGDRPEDDASIDVRGRFVLTERPPQRVHELAVVERGALGLIGCGMAEIPGVRPKGDLLDALQYTSFWWTPNDRRGFGFVVSPREGARLRELRRFRGPVSAHGLHHRLGPAARTLTGKPPRAPRTPREDRETGGTGTQSAQR